MFKTIERTIVSSRNGFTLVELAVVLAISGVILGAITASIKPVMQRIQMYETENNMNKIARQLSVYAVRHNRLPCPADPAPAAEPFGAERGSGADGAVFGNCKGNVETEGLVPYRALGLHNDDVRDGWGKYITYHVAPIFAVNPALPPTSDFNKVHESCRSPNWFPDDNDDSDDKSTYEAREEDFPGTSKSFKKTMDNGVEFEITSPGQNLKWYVNTSHNFKGMGTGTNNIWHEKVDVKFTAAVSDAVLVLDDVSDTIDGGTKRNIIYQVFYQNAAGHTDYFWQETQLRTDNDSNEVMEPDGYDSKYGNKPIYRNAVNSKNMGADGLVSFEILSKNYKAADGSNLFGPKSIQGITIYSHNEMPNDVGYVPDPGYPATKSSLLISKIKAGEISSGADHYNLNPSKARFCCPFAYTTGDYSVGNDIRIKDSNDEYMIDLQRSTTSGYFDDVDTKAATTTGLNTQNIAIAYVLVSHGKNGQGAFMVNGTADRIDGGNSLIGDDEIKNKDSDNEFVYKPITMQSGSEYFDDILLWRSQDQVYSEVSDNSCFKP